MGGSLWSSKHDGWIVFPSAVVLSSELLVYPANGAEMLRCFSNVKYRMEIVRESTFKGSMRRPALLPENWTIVS